MREILFRGKGNDNREWVYWNFFGELCRESGKRTRLAVQKGATISYYDYIHQIVTLIDAKTICQFTGLLDKNGKKIWENDIVDTHNRGHGYSRLERVIYENGGFFPISTHGWECEPDADEIEVIGNVFDNADLLEE